MPCALAASLKVEVINGASGLRILSLDLISETIKAAFSMPQEFCRPDLGPDDNLVIGFFSLTTVLLSIRKSWALIPLFLVGQSGGYFPIFFGLKCQDFCLTLTYEAERHRLHSTVDKL